MSISLTPSSYYSLTGNGSGSTGTATTPSSLTQSLAADLNAVYNGSSGSGSSAYSLNLSPAAQMLLNGGSGTGTSSSSSFTLTTAQQATITNILEKYKDSPFTQATFDSIQNDLEAAGLGADQLSAKDEVSSFDPTSSLISALNGNFSSMSGASAALNNEQTKASSYMQNIISQWQSMSGTAGTS